MKKTIILLAVVGMFSFMFISPANSLTTTGTIAVKAVIGASTPDMGFEIHKTVDGDPDHDVWTSYTKVSDLTFDKWEVVQRTGKAAQWASVTQNTIIVWASGRGDDYQILADGTGTLGVLPLNSLMCNPIYSPTDKWWIDYDADGVKDAGEEYEQGGPAPGAVGTAGNILGVTGKPIYSSESPVGSSRILQVQFMFPAYKIDGNDPFTGYVPIPSTTAAGTYSGAYVTVRIVAK